ncbi:MAG: hypothetical protein CM1200mP39_07470 [Dehalococcoidia bacterium]|nr:MAG: hypothetical protein CM1200mP39_07470 [Dehalococcoidia bacterium]
MSVIKAAFFDIYGTLAGFDPPREDIQMRAAEKLGFILTKGRNRCRIPYCRSVSDSAKLQ